MMTTVSDKRAIAMFQRAKAEREQRALNFEVGDGSPGVLPRVRLATSVDLSKHDPNCDRCDGGVRGYEVVDGDQIPIVCVCVSRGGGVERDKLDDLLDGHAQPTTGNRGPNRQARRAQAAKRRKSN